MNQFSSLTGWNLKLLMKNCKNNLADNPSYIFGYVIKIINMKQFYAHDEFMILIRFHNGI